MELNEFILNLQTRDSQVNRPPRPVSEMEIRRIFIHYGVAEQSQISV